MPDTSTREPAAVPPQSAVAKGASSPTGTLDLWDAVRTIISLQNQAPPLVPVARDGDIPVSFAQERLWLAEQLEPGRAAYNLPLAFRLRGALDITALRDSVKLLVQRHEALRTTFMAKAGVPIQIIQPVPEAPLQVIDLRSIPEAERQQQAEQLTKDVSQRPFDLQNGPLMRMVLLHLDEQEFVLLITVHHIVSDGWSEGVLLKDLAAMYNALSTRQPLTLPELPVQYADFTVWQRQWLQGDFLAALEQYWQQHLSGDLQGLRLPSDRPRPAAPTRRSADYAFTLSDTLVQELKQCARQHRVTLFPMLLAAFQVLLGRYCDQEDVLVCTPTAGRNRSELRGLIGYVVNLLVLRTDLSGAPTFLEVLDRVRQVTSGANAHQDLPTQAIANCATNKQVSLSQVLFGLQNTPRQPLNLAGLEVEALPVDNGAADFDLFLSLVEESGTLTGTLKYDTDLFDAASIHTLVQHFQRILEQVVRDPGQSIAAVLPLSAEEEQQLEQRRAIAHTPKATPVQRQITQEDAPRDAIEVKLTQIWQQVLGVSTLGIRDNFFDLGGQSLVALRMFALVEQEFGRAFPVATLFESPTIEQLATRLRDGGEAASWTSLVPLRSTGSKPPIFCIAPAGITALRFTKLAHHLGADQPFYVLQAQGLENTDHEAHTTLEAMVSHFIQEMRLVQPEGPYHLVGMCFGNLVAFEMAHYLKEQGQSVGLLAMIDPFNLASRELAAPRTLRLSLSYHKNAMSVLDFKGKLEYVYEKAERAVRKFVYKRYQRQNRPLPLALRGFYFQDVSDGMRRTYKAQPYSGSVTLLMANIRPQFQCNSIDEVVDGWKTLALGGVEVRTYAGHHDMSLKEPFVQELAAQIRDACDAPTRTSERETAESVVNA